MGTKCESNSSHYLDREINISIATAKTLTSPRSCLEGTRSADWISGLKWWAEKKRVRRGEPM